MKTNKVEANTVNHKGIRATVIADSISAAGDRITTMECRFPRIILAELNTHRMFSRNSASSRAIPVEKMIKQVEDDPFIPISWGKNQKGMQADVDLDKPAQLDCEIAWLMARDQMVHKARALIERGLHKQIANRLLEPWMWTTTIITATNWGNFYALRDHPAAEPHMQALARAMKAAHVASVPQRLENGQWHLPYVSEDERRAWENVDPGSLLAWSSARCARVSYLNHDGTKPDVEKDEALASKLQEAGHMSPFEHQARPTSGWAEEGHRQGNFRGWVQHRKLLENECRRVDGFR